jgi:LEA14-like dessication related protein
MEPLSRSTHTPHQLRSLLLLALVLLALGCASCGPQVIKGRPPFIGVAVMSLQGDVLAAEFRINNQNGVTMNIQAVEITVTVNGTTLIRELGDRQLSIDANSAEELRVERPADESTRSLLASLENREVQSLPFELAGRVRTQEDGHLNFQYKGHFYPVPGRPGSFRSAVTQTERLRRQDPL